VVPMVSHLMDLMEDKLAHDLDFFVVMEISAQEVAIKNKKTFLKVNFSLIGLKK
jgi:hypothetical protein